MSDVEEVDFNWYDNPTWWESVLYVTPIIQLKQKDADIKALNLSISQIQQQLRDSESLLGNTIKKNEWLRSDFLKLQVSIPDKQLEYFWNHKIKPRHNLNHFARNSSMMNVLRFISSNNDETPLIDGVSNDDKANKCLLWVKNNLVYKSDDGEHWQWADETLKRKKGDCEDGANLLHNMMLKAGVPYWRIRGNLGHVKGGYHCYVTYLREKDNEWYVLDWCYWPKESINYKLKWSAAENKYFTIDRSFNVKYGFQKEIVFDRE